MLWRVGWPAWDTEILVHVAHLIYVTDLCFCYLIYVSLLFLQLEKGAKLCKSNKWGDYPVHQAAFSGAKRCMELILAYGELMLSTLYIVKKSLNNLSFEN